VSELVVNFNVRSAHASYHAPIFNIYVY
jgi:hypothetical protein